MSNLVVNLPKVTTTTAESVEGAVTETIIVDCEASATVGKLVRLDPNNINRVLVATDNLINDPIIGEIHAKITTTIAEVALRGVRDKSLPVGKLYLSATGDYTVTAPPANYLQVLGYSFGNGKIHLEPVLNVTFRPA